MKALRTRKVLGRIAAAAVRRLSRHVAWHTSASLNLLGQASDRYAPIIIVGREHYSERRKSYPGLRRRDLEKILRQELSGEPTTIFVIGPIRGDRREVSFYRLDPDVIESLPRSLFVLPESVVLGATLGAEAWADIERQGYRYFLFRDGASQPAGGALAARELVAMAAGVDPGVAPEQWRGPEELLWRLRRALPALPVLTWWSCRHPVPAGLGLDRVAVKPIAVTAGLMLFGYLALASIYLQVVSSQRNGELEALGPDIQQGLLADNEARDYESRRDALIELWSGRPESLRLWEGAAIALQNRATLTRIEMQGGRVSLYGEAPDASEILASLAGKPQFTDVAFDAAVRSGRNGRQNFAISFLLAPPRAVTGPADE